MEAALTFPTETSPPLVRVLRPIYELGGLDMKSSRFSQEQIIGILKQGQAGVKVTDLCRQHGISDHTYYRWKSKFGGMEVSEAKRLGDRQ